MAKPGAELFDVDACNDPLLAEHERARDLLYKSDQHAAMGELEQLANCGSIMSTLLVADALRTGWVYGQDLPGAEAWYRVAAESGSARGLCGLGLTHLQMDRFSEAIQDLEAAIARDYPPAYNDLAGIYFRGDGVPVDRQRARALWRKGASLGHLPAKQNLIQQSYWGRYGFWGRLEAVLKLLPFAIEIAKTRATNRYTDRLR